jgi:hypothetical protein
MFTFHPRLQELHGVLLSRAVGMPMCGGEKFLSSEMLAVGLE